MSTRALLYIYRVQPTINRLFFFKDGSYFKIDKGFLYFLYTFSQTYFFYQSAIVNISLQDKWISGTMGNFIWLDSNYKTQYSNLQNSTIVLKYLSSYILFIHFNLS